MPSAAVELVKVHKEGQVVLTYKIQGGIHER